MDVSIKGNGNNYDMKCTDPRFVFRVNYRMFAALKFTIGIDAAPGWHSSPRMIFLGTWYSFYPFGSALNR